MARRVTHADLPIETARPTLRRFRISDAPALLALYGDSEVVRYLCVEPMQPDDLGEAQEAHLRENEFVKAEWTDAVVFAMLTDEWIERGGVG